jgi:hypothetical protein
MALLGKKVILTKKVTNLKKKMEIRQMEFKIPETIFTRRVRPSY